MRHQFRETMKLHEIYEGYVRFKSVRAIASKILTIDKQIRRSGKCKQEDYDWLLLKCEDEGVLNGLEKEAKRYTNFGRMDYGDGAYLTSASEFATALNILHVTKNKLDASARTKIQQATDEVVHSDEMRELAKQQAYIDLQNAYSQTDNESAERVGALADLATGI